MELNETPTLSRQISLFTMVFTSPLELTDCFGFPPKKIYLEEIKCEENMKTKNVPENSSLP